MKAVLIISIVLLLLSASVLVIKYAPQDTHPEPKARISTAFGCLEVKDTITEFRAKNQLLNDMFGFEYHEC